MVADRMKEHGHSRSLSLAAVVRVLGGDLYDHGFAANVPAPGHSRGDRSVSLKLTSCGRLLIHVFSRGGWREVRDQLESLGFVDHAGDVRGLTDAKVRRDCLRASTRQTAGARTDAARGHWSDAEALSRSLGTRYFKLRAIRRPLPGPDVLRQRMRMPVAAYRDSGWVQPALLAGVVSEAGELTGIEVTYLDGDGRRSRRLTLSRKTIGVRSVGSAIRLDPAAPEILVGEGCCTTLSATERFQLPGWALMSVGNLRRWTPPEGVRSVLIAGDRGAQGEAGAAELERRLRRRGVAARVELPPEPHGDWNEVAVAERQKEMGGLGRVRCAAGLA